MKDYYKSDQFGKHLLKSSLNSLLVKLEQTIFYYNHNPDKLPKFIPEDLFNKTIHMLVDFRNKLYPKSMIINLDWIEEELIKDDVV